jgi:hypothetical protein
MPKRSPTRRNMVRIYNKTTARWHSYVIDFTVGWSFGEQQDRFPKIRSALEFRRRVQKQWQSAVARK